MRVSIRKAALVALSSGALVMGGAMADLLGWRWEFGIQVPPILLAVVVAVLTIPDDLGLKRARVNVWTALKAFDFRGSVLMTLAVTFLVLGLVGQLSQLLTMRTAPTLD